MTSANKRPAPLVPAYVDLRDVAIPREAFALMAATEFGISYDEALSFIVEAADRIEDCSSRQVRRGRERAREAAAGLHRSRLQ